MKKTLSRSLSLLLAVVLAVSLTLPAAATFPITLDQSKATIAPKDSITLTATLSSEYANKSVTWESSDKTVAEVSNTNSKKQTATITAKAEGYATITASVGNVKASCDVTVAKSKVTSLTIDPAGPEVLPIGKTRTAQAGPQPQRLGHGAARAKHPGKGNAQLPQGVVRGRTLRLQVARQHKADLFFRRVCFFQAELCRPEQELRLRCLPAGLPQPVVRRQFVEACRQRPFPLFFSAHCRIGCNDRLFCKAKGVSVPCRHPDFLLSGLIFSAVCVILFFCRDAAIFLPPRAYGR